MRNPAFLLVIAGLAGCFGTGPSEVGPGDEFELAPNQSARIAGTNLTIGFRRVAGDSRCPIDAACLVEGEAGIELNLFGASVTNPVLISEPLPAAWTNDAYEVRLLDLRPHRTTGVPIRPDEYRLRLQVSPIPR